MSVPKTNPWGAGTSVRIGLEIHIQLETQSKLFCGCAVSFGAPPNHNVCPICAGLPGALPTPNQHAVELAVRLALALGSELQTRSSFARKSYFYPDLPKGYQITQHQKPLARGGAVELVLDGQTMSVPLSGLHLEEDAGKSVHRHGQTLVDLNRAGVPLVEVVTRPVLDSPEQAAAFMRELRAIVRTLGVSSGDLEKGSMRCDANVSLLDAVHDTPRVELKNINSFRFVKRAIAGEIARQKQALALGHRLTQQTRRYDAARDRSFAMRQKERRAEYRYFDEPDLPTLLLHPELIEAQRALLPELPVARAERLARELSIAPDQAALLCSEKALADYFETTVGCGAAPKKAASFVTTELLARVGDARLQDDKLVPPEALAQLLAMVRDGQLSGRQAKLVFGEMWKSGKDAQQVVVEMGLERRAGRVDLLAVIDEVLALHTPQIVAYRGGKKRLLGFFVGAVMKRTAGNADPHVVNQLLRQKLDE